MTRQQNVKKIIDLCAIFATVGFVGSAVSATFCNNLAPVLSDSAHKRICYYSGSTPVKTLSLKQ
jgi:hypothetical protein